MSMQYLSTADLSTVYLSFYSFVSANCLLSIADLSTYVHWLPPTCLPSTCLSKCFVSANCLPVHRRTVHPCSLTIRLPPTFLPSTCLPIPLHQPIAYLSTADLPTYVHWLPDYHRLSAVYLSSYSFASVNCLPVRLSTYLIISMQYLSTADLSTFFSIPLYLPTNYLSTTDLSTYVHWLPPTCLRSICLSIPLYLPTAYLSTADL